MRAATQGIAARTYCLGGDRSQETEDRRAVFSLLSPVSSPSYSPITSYTNSGAATGSSERRYAARIRASASAARASLAA